MKNVLRLQINNKDAEEFVFSPDDQESFQKLIWENDEEFSLNGKMYDVKAKKVENGKMIIRCIADEKETALVNKMNNNWKESEKSNKLVNELFQLFQNLFHNSKTTDIAFTNPAKQNFFFPLEKLPVQLKKIPTPPPQS